MLLPPSAPPRHAAYLLLGSSPVTTRLGYSYHHASMAAVNTKTRGLPGDATQKKLWLLAEIRYIQEERAISSHSSCILFDELVKIVERDLFVGVSKEALAALKICLIEMEEFRSAAVDSTISAYNFSAGRKRTLHQIVETNHAAKLIYLRILAEIDGVLKLQDEKTPFWDELSPSRYLVSAMDLDLDDFGNVFALGGANWFQLLEWLEAFRECWMQSLKDYEHYIY